MLPQYGTERAREAQVRGTTEAFEVAQDSYVEKGRFLSRTDVDRAAPVAVIGTDIEDALFPFVEAVGKEITLDGRRFTVIGVLQKKGKFLFRSMDNIVLVPVNSIQKQDRRFNFMMADVKPLSPGHIEAAIDQTREAMRRYRKLKYLQKDNFGILGQDTLTDLYQQITGGIYLVMIAISSIGLLVGGVGVMTIMLVSVTERTREIGLRMAVGARARHILRQFLIEAIALCLVGGALGILLGHGGSYLVWFFLRWPVETSPVAIAEGRGAPWEHDPGPPVGRGWARLVAVTPDYRGLGEAVRGRETFRGHFGPMFYRGRLTDGDVRVLVIGQEGAQDESLGHRCFVGGTGARMQACLRHLGITESYLFLNTFVYPINGQYDGAKLRWLAQDLDSPIAKHRQANLDYVIDRNDLRLVVAVGVAAKESVVTWVKSHGGQCPAGAAHVSRCDGSVLRSKTHVVGVRHPGGAGKGGSVSDIIADFKKAIAQIEGWSSPDPSWLPPDPGAQRLPADDYRARSGFDRLRNGSRRGF